MPSFSAVDGSWPDARLPVRERLTGWGAQQGPSARVESENKLPSNRPSCRPAVPGFPQLLAFCVREPARDR